MATYRFEIGGIDRTTSIEPGVSFDKNSGGRGNARFVTKDPGGTWKPDLNETFEVIRDDVSPEVVLWSGEITRITEREERTWPDASLFCDVACSDATAICDRRVVLRYYSELTGGTLADVASSLVADYLADDGYTYGGAPGVLVNGITFAAITLREAFDQLAAATGTSWIIGADKSVTFYTGAAPVSAAAVDLTDALANYIDVRITRAGSRQANRVYIRNNRNLGGTWTDTFSGNGVQTIFPTVMQLSAAPIVQVNGVDQYVVEFALIGSSPGYDWYWIQDGHGVIQNPADPELTGGDVLTVTYQSPLPYIAIAEDAASIAANGLIERVIEVVDYTDTATLDDLAARQLAELAAEPEEVEITTFVDEFEPGQLLTITTAVPSISGDYLIESVSAREEDQIQFRYSLRCASQAAPQAGRRSNPATYFREIIDATRRPMIDFPLLDSSPQESPAGGGAATSPADDGWYHGAMITDDPLAVGTSVMDAPFAVLVEADEKVVLEEALAVAQTAPTGTATFTVKRSTDGTSWSDVLVISISSGQRRSSYITSFLIDELNRGDELQVDVDAANGAQGVTIHLTGRITAV
jgi:hypothetical protein